VRKLGPIKDDDACQSKLQLGSAKPNSSCAQRQGIASADDVSRAMLGRTVTNRAEDDGPLMGADGAARQQAPSGQPRLSSSHSQSLACPDPPYDDTSREALTHLLTLIAKTTKLVVFTSPYVG
jgi:hypothetical protein